MAAHRLYPLVFLFILLGLDYTLHAQSTISWETIPEHVRERKAFQRLEWFYRQRMIPADTLPLAHFFETMDLEKEREAALRANGYQSDVTWSQMGPSGIPSTWPPQWGVVSGRVRGLAVHPTNPDIVYIGAASGGIWKTTNGGDNWLDVGFDLASLTFGAIAIDPQNPEIVYAGSGEAMRFFNHVVYDGRGLYKSTNGGIEWLHITDGFGTHTHFSALRVSPHDSQIIFAALASGYWPLGNPSNEGLWRSTNGGLNWTRTLNVNDAFDVLPHPTIPGRVYGATGGGSSSGSVPGFYISTNHGATWVASNSGIPSPSGIDRIHLAIAPAEPSTVYALIYRSSPSGSMQLYRSTNDGVSWSPASSSLASSQGWYDLVVAVNPDNVNEVYIGDAELRRSTDGGSTFNFVGGSFWNQAMHVDFHTMAFAPSNPAIRYVGCDGGIYRSTNGGATWHHRNNGLPTIQFYRLSSHPYDSLIIIGGAQDNGLYRSLAGGVGEWPLVSTGDGMESFFDYDVPSTVYASTQNAGLVRSFSGGSYGTFTSIRPNFGSESVAWTAPFFIHPIQSTWIYTASTRPYRSTNQGASWTAMTPSALGSSAINAMTISSANPNHLILAASQWNNDPPVWISTNGGSTWIDVSNNIPGPNRFITRVVCHPLDANTMFIVRSGYGSGKIYRTTNLGVTWENRSGDLPDIPYNDLFVDPAYPDHFYVANDFGVYRSTNQGTSWLRLGNGMPYVPAMHFSYGEYGSRRLLRVGTHGRSMFQTTLPPRAGVIIALSPSNHDYGKVATGTASDTLSVSVSSIGTEPVIVTEITHTDSAFALANLPPLPYAINPQSSLVFDVVFRPTQHGLRVDTITIASNDSLNPTSRVYLTGKGVVIGSAGAGVIYATSGVPLSNLYTIDPQSGVPSIVGATDVNEIHGLTIRPTTNELYGAYSTASQTTIYRLSAQYGDAIAERIFPLGNLRAIAFNGEGTLYGATTMGRLYRLDLSTGDTTFIGAAAGIVYSGLAFSPTTGVLWASVRPPLTGRDRIYTVNTSTGQVTLVGSTGDNQITPSIAFGPTGALYGLKGFGMQTNTLIEIDTLTAAGTLIGSTGLNALLAIAMRTDSVVVGIGEAISELPRGFSLEQNYPNPFNPSTNVRFQVASFGLVSLKVYNLLGQTVATLVNEEKQPGHYEVVWDAGGMASGVYFYRLSVSDHVETKKLVLLR